MMQDEHANEEHDSDDVRETEAFELVTAWQASDSEAMTAQEVLLRKQTRQTTI